MSQHPSIHYNSCRNRHCPLCQGLNKEIWVDKRNQDLLHAPYFHTVFTLPHELHPLIYQNQKLLYHLMYKSVSETLNFYAKAKPYKNHNEFKQLINQCYEKNWYTYTKKTFSGPAAVIQYLGRYTHRIAISNNRIVSMNQDSVTFVLKKDPKTGQPKTITLKATEFIRRFLMHTLPKGFVKIRYYGILANRNTKSNIALCRKLTASPVYQSKYEGLKKIEIVSMMVKRDITLCSKCQKENMALTSTYHPQEAVP